MVDNQQSAPSSETESDRAASTHPLGEAPSGLAVALHRLDVEHRRIRRSFAEMLGMSTSEFNALMLLGEMGQLTPTQLAQLLGMTTGSATALIDRLETEGHLARKRHPSDRRSLLLQLTANGDRAKDAVFRHYLDAIDTVVASVTTPSERELIDLLTRVTDGIHAADMALKVTAVSSTAAHDSSPRAGK